jgi:hypothetical protein
MQSLAFIKQAKVLTDKLNAFNAVVVPAEEELEQGAALQKEINQLFQGLQNPSLPSASKLATLVQESGFQLDAKVRHRIEQAESFWS